jgi:hypothetical protein
MKMDAPENQIKMRVVSSAILPGQPAHPPALGTAKAYRDIPASCLAGVFPIYRFIAALPAFRIIKAMAFAGF